MLEIVFVAIALAAIPTFYFGAGKNNWVWITFGVWGLVLSALAISGIYEVTDTIPPRISTVFIPTVAIVIFIYKKIRTAEINCSWLIAIHILRIPVEICLHQLFLEGLLPEKMTYSGFNYDIFSGISAVLILILHLKGKLTPTILKLWNIVAMLLLAIVVITAVLSVPSAFQLLSFDQPNKAVLLFPYVLLPGVIVPLVLLSHLVMLKKLRTK
jgi:hypothetical protein